MQHDIVDDGIAALLDEVGPNAVIHCAAHPGGKSLQEPVDNVRVNLTGSMRLFEWAARNGKRVIFLSSSAVYGDQPDIPLTEDLTPRPGTIYAIGKVACEEFLKTLHLGYGLESTTLRLFATYGAGHKPNLFQGIVNIILTQIQNGDELIIKGSLARKRSFLYVDDAARLILKAYQDRRLIGKTINLSHPEMLDIKGIIDRVCNAVGKNRDDLKVVVEDGTVADTFYNYADTSVMQKEFGLLPETNLPTASRCFSKKGGLTMCGIFVVVDKSNAAIDEAAAQHALSMLKDRGPDLCLAMRPRQHVFIGQTVLSLVGVARDAETNTDFGPLAAGSRCPSMARFITTGTCSAALPSMMTVSRA